MNYNNLNEFTHWYRDNKYPINIPDNAIVYPTDVSYSICVYKDGLYQVELYIARPEFISSRHSHPFDQQIIFLGGDMFGRRGNKDTVGKLVHYNNVHKHQIFPILPAGDWHEVGSGNNGFMFYNCQKWPNIELMTSAVVEYIGEPLGNLHKIIKK